ncbi:MAG TPA: sigma-70 family RNA polymerase sigma factor [Solirubrobacterales bacterium]
MSFNGEEITPREGAEKKFARLYAENGRHVMAYALRRAGRPEDAADAVSETFLVAWRRVEDLPPEEEIQPWLYGVARRVLANQRRGDVRRARLGERLRHELPRLASTDPAPDIEDVPTRILNRMEARDREVLLLAGWEGLGPAQIATVLGISGPAARNRLHRARRRFRKELERAEAQRTPHCELELEEAR